MLCRHAAPARGDRRSTNVNDLTLSTVVHHIQRDLTAHFFAKPVPELVLRLEPNGIMEEYNNHAEATGQFTGALYKLINPHAPDKRRIAVFGDSYSFTEGVTYVLFAAFESVVFFWSKDVVRDLVTAQSIDVVIWEHAERFMTLPSEKQSFKRQSPNPSISRRASSADLVVAEARRLAQEPGRGVFLMELIGARRAV